MRKMHCIRRKESLRPAARNMKRLYQLSERPEWGLLPVELMAKIFNQLPHKDRHSIIPLVCREFHRIHLAYPQRPRDLQLSGAISLSKLEWVSGLMSSLVFLDVRCDGDAGLLAQLLAVLASAKKLHTVFLDGGRHQLDVSVLRSLAMLRSIEVLDMAFHFPDDGNADVIRHLSSLQSLKVVCLELHVDGASIEQAAVFWGAMGALDSLTTMELSVYDINAPEEHVGYDFFHPVNQMTQIRELTISGDSCMGAFGTLPWGFTAMQQLEILHLRAGPVGFGGLYPVQDLPRLRDLDFHIEVLPYLVEGGTIINLDCTSLTRLSIGRGDESDDPQWCSIPADKLLNPAMPALRNLQELRLRDLDIYSFPYTLAAALKNLTHLDLGVNHLKRIPPSLAWMTSLQWLSLACNPALQLVPSDVATFRALTRLRKLYFYKVREDAEDAGLSQQSVEVLLAIKEQSPHLQMS